MRKPRPFSHSPIYIDERRERLAAIERRARAELGLPVAPAPRHIEFPRPRQKASPGSARLLLLAAVLALVWWLLVR